MRSLGIFAAALLGPLTVAAQDAYQIRGVTDPVFHLYLQGLAEAGKPNNESAAVLGPEETADTFVIDQTIQSNSTGLYLNIEPNEASYKRLVLQEESTTNGWGLEGDTIITTEKSEFGRQLNYVVCAATEGYYQLYLQTGNDLPEGDCANHLTIHLPCLC